MSRKNAKPPYRRLLISLSVSVILVVASVQWVDRIQWEILPRRLIWPLLRLHLFILVGLAVGQIVEILGWTRKLGVVARPLFRFGRLDDRCGAAFTTAWFSGAAANAMLHGFYQDGKISRKQLFLTNFINQLPSYFLHLPTTFFIVLPLTGVAGVLYFLLTFLATMLRTAAYVLFGRLVLPVPGVSPDGASPDRLKARRTPTGVIEGLKRKLPSRMTGVALYVVPIYVIVFIVNGAGGFDALRQTLASYVVTALVPVESLSVVVLSFAAEFTSGFAAAGALMDAGVLTVKQTVLALLIGNVLAFPIRALRHQLPRYMGIFAPKTGVQMLLMGQAFRVLSLVTVGTIYFFTA